MVPDGARSSLRRPWPAWWSEAAVACGAAAALLAVTAHIAPAAGERSLDRLGVLLVLSAGGAVGFCRRAPAVSLAVVSVALAGYLVRDHPGGPIFLTAWVSVGALSWRSGRVAGLAGAAALCTVLLGVASLEDGSGPVVALVLVGWSLAAVLAGDVLRSRAERIAEAEAHAHSRERERDQAMRREVAEDRLRIARDIHDSVAHAIAAINVQAGAAAHVVDRRPTAAKEALEVIQRTSADALDELAAILGLLRQAGEPAERLPAHALSDVPALLATASAANLVVSLTTEGPLHAVPAPVERAAYRIVQESVTNAIRHAPGSCLHVSLVAHPDGGLRVQVADDGGGAGATDGGAGMGIRGMRERAEATGGTLVAGAQPCGGWLVCASWERP